MVLNCGEVPSLNKMRLKSRDRDIGYLFQGKKIINSFYQFPKTKENNLERSCSQTFSVGDQTHAQALLIITTLLRLGLFKFFFNKNRLLILALH